MKYDIFDTALGPCGVRWSPRGICGVQLPMADADTLTDKMRQDGAEAGRPTRAVGVAMRKMQRHLDGRLDPLTSLELDLSALTPFRAAISQVLRTVGPGQTITYGELARAVGKPGATQAAGSAMANNPLPLVIPCHRVLAAGGSLGGFSAHGGVKTKLRLLSVEGADLALVARRGIGVLRRSDPLLGEVIGLAKKPYRVSTMQADDPFTVLCQSIVHQQVSMKAGATIFGRLLAVGGHGKKMSTRKVLAAPVEALRGVGLSGMKVSYVKDLAHKSQSGELPLKRLVRMDDAAIIEALIAVKGIGIWSAQMFLMFHLGRLDVLPVGDLGLRKGVQRVYGLPKQPTPAELKERAQAWAPFRSIATWYFWRALELIAAVKSGGL